MAEKNKTGEEISVLSHFIGISVKIGEKERIIAGKMLAFPESLKGRVEKIDKDIVEKSEKSAEITPDMTFEDFEKAKSTLGIETNEELLKYLTGKDKKDLAIYLRPFIKG